jgi:hypothetical protein
MTDDVFGRLLYTDCRPGTGRGAGGGFQVQALSPNVDPQQSSFAVGWLLYEAQPPWVTDRRPVEEFPLGFAHACAEGYGTAQGRYVGKEAVGGRMGNHLADCLLTRNPALYGSIRPAQLWRSPLWRDKAWDTIDAPTFDGDLEPGLDLEKVPTWVRERPERGPVLARLLSVLEDADGPRVAIVSADIDQAMRWIAAATLLLPQRQALELSFKAFSAAPLRARHRLVGAPPDLNPDLRPGRSSGMFVVDADTCTSDEATVTERAAFLAGRLAGEADPYDVVDAADLADELSAGAWPQDIAAVHTAWALTLPDEPVTDPGVLFRWLRMAEDEQLRDYGPTLTQTLLAGDAPADVLRWLDAAATDEKLRFNHEVIRGRLLSAEIAEVFAGTAPPPQTLPPVALSDQARRDAESALTSVLLRRPADKVNETEFDRTLRLARRHRTSLEPALPLLKDHLVAFAAIWLRTRKPGDPRDPRHWALGEFVVARVQDVLRDLYARDRSRPARDKVRLFSPYLTDAGDPTSPLYYPLKALAIRETPDEAGKVRQLEELLAEAEQLREHGGNAGEAEDHLQQALIDCGASNEALAVLIVTRVTSAPVKPEIRVQAMGWLAKMADQLDAEVLRMVRSLSEAKGSLPAELAQIADADQKVDEFIALTNTSKIVQEPTFSRAVSLVQGADPAVVEIRMPEILEASRVSPDLAGAVYAALPKGKKQGSKPGTALEALLEQGFSSLTTFEAHVDFGVMCAIIYARPGLSRERMAKMAEILRRFQLVVISKSGQKAAEKWRSEVGRQLRREEQSIWERTIPPASMRDTRR